LVCIIEDINQSLNQCYYFCNGLYGESSEVNGYRGENIDIFNFLCDNNKLFISLVERIFVFDENEVNNRIINAFIIYSRIVYEHSNAQKFILYIMAIEALIGYDNESLSELLSGFLSALLSKNEETYNVVKANFKKVYTQRSDISHGSTVYILKDDVRDAEWYCINLIYSFIINEEITQIKKTKELKKYLENKVKSLEMKTDESI